MVIGNTEAQLEYIHITYMFGTNLYAQLVFSNKISASEFSRKFIKSVLLVGCRSTVMNTLPFEVFIQESFVPSSPFHTNNVGVGFLDFFAEKI